MRRGCSSDGATLTSGPHPLPGRKRWTVCMFTATWLQIPTWWAALRTLVQACTHDYNVWLRAESTIQSWNLLGEATADGIGGLIWI